MGSLSYPAPYRMITGGPFLGSKAAGAWNLPLTSAWPSWRCAWLSSGYVFMATCFPITHVWAHPSTSPIGTGDLSPGGLTLGAWSWPFRDNFYLRLTFLERRLSRIEVPSVEAFDHVARRCVSSFTGLWPQCRRTHVTCCKTCRLGVISAELHWAVIAMFEGWPVPLFESRCDVITHDLGTRVCYYSLLAHVLAPPRSLFLGVNELSSPRHCIAVMTCAAYLSSDRTRASVADVCFASYFLSYAPRRACQLRYKICVVYDVESVMEAICQTHCWPRVSSAVRVPLNSFKVNVKVKGEVALVLNQAPRHEDVLGEWRCSSTHSWPWH
jgi:hypothetical protein